MQTVFVFVFIVLFFIVWGVIVFRNWWNRPRIISIPEDEDFEHWTGEAAEILKEAGYEQVASKHKVPVTVWLDHKKLESRIYIDYFVRKAGKVYIVKLAKERKPLRMTGSEIRDRLLSYAFLYEEVDGILYVDRKAKTIQTIRFELEL